MVQTSGSVQFGDDVYEDLGQHRAAIDDYLDKEQIAITPKNRTDLFRTATWVGQREIMETAEKLMERIGLDEFSDFNLFEDRVLKEVKALRIKTGAPVIKQILNAMSWRDESAARVVKKRHRLSPAKLSDLLAQLTCKEDSLPDYGYWPSDNAWEYIEYEADSELRDTENIPLKQAIHEFFIAEVRPYAADAWLSIGQTKVGYEISFNKHFYKHRPLRSLEDVTRDILDLEAETEGLLKKLVSLAPSQAKAA